MQTSDVSPLISKPADTDAGPTCPSPSRVLPALPEDAAAQDKVFASIRGRNSLNGAAPSTKYRRYFQEYYLLSEYSICQREKLPGIYVIPSAKSPLRWYQEGVFKFTLTMPPSYPDGDPPKLHFEPPVFHPLVDSETGELNMSKSFPRWRRNVNHLCQVLLYARRIFFKIDSRNPSNGEAAVLFTKNEDLYRKKVAENVSICNEMLYAPPTTDDAHAIRFTRYEEQQHGDARRKMLQPKKLENPQLGLSFMSAAKSQVFSKVEEVKQK